VDSLQLPLHEHSSSRALVRSAFGARELAPAACMVATALHNFIRANFDGATGDGSRYITLEVTKAASAIALLIRKSVSQIMRYNDVVHLWRNEESRIYVEEFIRDQTLDQVVPMVTPGVCHISAGGQRLETDKALATSAGRKESELSPVRRDSIATGELFPGRPACRSGVRISSAKRMDLGQPCSKKFVFAEGHTPGLVVVVCVCRRPKILGIKVMAQAENMEMIMSVLLRRFSVLPDTVYYDAACKLSHTISLRVPEVLDRLFS
jgi:hypothetical protein